MKNVYCSFHISMDRMSTLIAWNSRCVKGIIDQICTRKGDPDGRDAVETLMNHCFFKFLDTAFVESALVLICTYERSQNHFSEHLKYGRKKGGAKQSWSNEFIFFYWMHES